MCKQENDSELVPGIVILHKYTIFKKISFNFISLNRETLEIYFQHIVFYFNLIAIFGAM